jgi:predicted DNA-binding protein (MmcQ/YjbR family)
MTLDTVRSICRAFPDVTEDIKWGADLAFSVGGKMFCVVYVEPPHHISFKCTPEDFGELVERPGIIPAPYLARAMWVQERELGEVLDRIELERLLRTAYELVRAKLPKRMRTTPSDEARTQPSRPARAKPRKPARASAGRRSAGAPARARRRRR